MKEKENRWKLGMFVVFGLAIFLVTVYFVGASQSLFGSTFHLQTRFKDVSGLEIGNNVLLSGINVGTIKKISFMSDTVVAVDMVIRSEIRHYIKKDALASIGTDGLVGDKILTISPGTGSQEIVKDYGTIGSQESVGIQDIMDGLKKSVDNAQIITKELSEFSVKINNGKGALSMVLTDENFAKNIDGTLKNLKTSSDEFADLTQKLNDKDGTFSKLLTDPYYTNSIKNTLSNLEASSAEINKFTVNLNQGKGLLPKLVSEQKFTNSFDSIMNNVNKGSEKLIEIEAAAKHNFLFRGYFKKQKKEDARRKLQHSTELSKE